MKITHYEVYADKGKGWQLEGRYALEQRQDAFNHAKEFEIEQFKVKIIKESFDVQDNSYQESVEYVSNLNRKSGKSRNDLLIGENEEENPIESSDGGDISGSGVAGAVFKLVFLIVLCLVLTNGIVSLLYPVIENFVSEEKIDTVLFLIFFLLFIGTAIPLILKKVPWYAFTANKSLSGGYSEKDVYTRAKELVTLYNLNDSINPDTTPAYPEAPLEYKHYIISFLTELLAKIRSDSALQTRFSKLGIKLIVYGGCLEMARYSGLTLSETNSVLYEAFQILDGKDADLEAFYEAKRSYKDNKVAIFLTGVGAYLMASVIQHRPMPEELLNITFNRWESLNKSEDDVMISRSESEIITADDIMKTTVVSIKNDLKFLDDNVSDKENIATKSSSEIHNIVMVLANKFKGEEVAENEGITSLKFKKLNNAMKFVINCMKDIGAYQEEVNSESQILRNCCVLLPFKEKQDVDESEFLADVFEHVYNGEVIMDKEIASELENTDYEIEALGEKMLERTKLQIELFKLISLGEE